MIQKTTIENNLPSTVSSIEISPDMSGNYIQINLKNGAVLRVTAENDGVHYYAPQNYQRDDGDNPTVSVLCDMGAGMHNDAPTEVTVMRGADCKMLDVNHY